MYRDRDRDLIDHLHSVPQYLAGQVMQEWATEASGGCRGVRIRERWAGVGRCGREEEGVARRRGLPSGQEWTGVGSSSVGNTKIKDNC